LPHWRDLQLQDLQTSLLIVSYFFVPLEFLHSLSNLLSTADSILAKSSLDARDHTITLLHELLSLSENLKPTNSERKLFQLRETLKGYPGNLAKPERSFIMEGPMELLENGTARKYHWFLFNDKLVSATPMPHQVFQFVNFYPLLNAVVESTGPIALSVQNAGPDDLFLRVSSTPEKNQWVKSIEGVVSEWKSILRNQMLDKEKRYRNIIDEMKKHIKCSDYGGIFKSYKNSFTGTDCIYFFIQKVPGCNTREEAEALGTQLLQGGYIMSCTNLTEFKEKNAFYRFSE